MVPKVCNLDSIMRISIKRPPLSGHNYSYITEAKFLEIIGHEHCLIIALLASGIGFGETRCCTKADELWVLVDKVNSIFVLTI